MEAADSSEPKRSDSNSERSDSLPTLNAIILASFREFSEQEQSILIWEILRHLEQNYLIYATNIAPLTLRMHPIRDIDA